MNAEQWVVFNPMEGDFTEHATEKQAVDDARDLIQVFLDDGHWDEAVENVYVAKVAHTPRKIVLGVKAEMTTDQWDELTGGSECDEWWDYTIGDGR